MRCTSCFDELGELQLSPDKRDLSFSEFVGQRKVGAEAAVWATNYVEGFNAADADRISIRALAKQQAAEDAISADRLFRVVEGYARVPEYLLWRFHEAGGELFRSMAVRSVTWEPGQVEVATQSDRVLLAKSAILTLPLGILQARRVAFLPQPVEILKAADSLVMGPAARVVYEFDSTFWRQFVALKGVCFFFAPEATPPTWWTTSPKPGSTLTGWIAGRKTKRLEMDLLPETGLENALIHAGQHSARGEETPASLAYARLADRSLQPGRLHLRSPRGYRCLRPALAAGGANPLLCRRAYRHQRPLGYRTWSAALRVSSGAAVTCPSLNFRGSATDHCSFSVRKGGNGWLWKGQSYG